MAFPLPVPEAVTKALPPGTSVLLALSGGVDSGLTLALMAHLDCEIETVTFRNFCYGDMGETSRNCCSLDAIEGARRLAVQVYGGHLGARSDRDSHDPDSRLNSRAWYRKASRRMLWLVLCCPVKDMLRMGTLP